MEKSYLDTRLRVKNKFASYIKHLWNTNKLLCAIQLDQAEEIVPEHDETYAYFRVRLEEGATQHDVAELQNYINSLCNEAEVEDKLKGYTSGIGNCSSMAGEDSSYDSDYEGSEEQPHGHDDVSRTVSDTLGMEFAEYVSTGPSPQPDSAYQSKVEFALKLGYTEKLVQAALQKLGPNPEQNELLAELIKLGAHQHSCSRPKGDTDCCDHLDEFSDQNLLSNIERNKLRPIVVDGSNVAMSHGNKEVFSCRGIKICVDWFRARGHTEITVFVPKWRKETPRPDNPVIDQEILYELERERLLVFTPSREVGGKRMVCYDDRYILKLAAENDGIVVSNDNYRDLIPECPEFRKVVEERILMYSFVNDRFMPPDDPLGRSGPTLDNFLKMPSFRRGETCPYGKKCTYGNKCKYSHPERGLGPQKSVTERLVENAQKQLLARHFDSSTSKKLKGKSLSLPLQSTTSEEGLSFMGQSPISRKQPLSRAKSTTLNSKNDLVESSKTTPKSDPTRSLGECIGLSTCNAGTPPPSVHVSHPRQNPSFYRVMYPVSSIPLNQSETQSYIQSGSPTIEHDPSTNLHRKLQRQLSINPTCDPRIYQMQRQFTTPETPHHLPASRHFSYQDRNYLTPHSNVTRISSAPPATPPYSLSSDYTHGSCSDPQLNMSNPRVPSNYPNVTSSSSLWPMHSPHTPAPHNYMMMPQNVEETRRKLHYHLASIFPEEQVDAAMRYYPNETNPQKICTAILSMFSSKS